MYKISAVLGTLLVAAAGFFMPRFIVNMLDTQGVYEYDLELAMIEYNTEAPEAPEPSDELKALKFPFYSNAMAVNLSENVMRLTPSKAINSALDALEKLKKYSLFGYSPDDYGPSAEYCACMLCIAPPGLLYSSDNLYSMTADQIAKMVWCVDIYYGSGMISFFVDDRTGKLSNFTLYNAFCDDDGNVDEEALIKKLLNFLEDYYEELDFTTIDSANFQNTYVLNAADKNGENLRLQVNFDELMMCFNS